MLLTRTSYPPPNCFPVVVPAFPLYGMILILQLHLLGYNDTKSMAFIIIVVVIINIIILF